MTKKIRTYSAEFKAEAVKDIADSNGNTSAITNCITTRSDYQSTALQRGKTRVVLAVGLGFKRV